MKSYELLSSDQQEAISHIYERGESFIVGDMGAGKSVIALTAACELLREKQATRVLIVSPLRVAHDVWSAECQKWSHLQDFSVIDATGSPAHRSKIIESDAPLVVINFEVVPWLFDTYGKDHGFDALIIDEASKLKAGGKTFKKLRPRLNDFDTRVCLTGTPVSENWEGLFYQVMVCDNGEAFGRNKKNFLHRYFYPTDYNEYNWELRMGADKEIYDRIRNLMVIVPDYRHTLPPLNEITQAVHLEPEEKALYDAMERDMILEEEEVIASNAAVVTGKLQQIASGFVYTDAGETVQVHTQKTIFYPVGADQVIFVYQFKEELRRLQERFPNSSRQLGVSADEDIETLRLWRSGELEHLLLHPKSAGHGLDLTAGHTMVIMSPIWSGDLTRQVIARIWRRNQTKPCNVYTLCALGTIDEEIMDREREKLTHMELLRARAKSQA